MQSKFSRAFKFSVTLLFIFKFLTNLRLTYLLNKYTYTLSRNSPYTPSAISLQREFDREPLKLHKQMIPHFLALDVGVKICQAQLCSSIRGCHTTSPLKSVFFTRKVAWQHLIKLHSWAWDILTPTSRAKKWGIIFLCTSSGSHSNLLQSQKWKWAYHQLQYRVYIPTNFFGISGQI